VKIFSGSTHLVNEIWQALIYPLTVASKSSVPGRKMAANKILTKMKEHSESLVNQAIMVSDEQIRIAILWHEQWHEALEEASRLFFGERQVSSSFIGNHHIGCLQYDGSSLVSMRIRIHRFRSVRIRIQIQIQRFDAQK
jgi:hypothetical protein